MGPRLGGRGKPLGRLFTPGSTLGFNGATARRPWKDDADGTDANDRAASMGPRLGGRGKRRPSGRTGPARRGFNGATARRPWKGSGSRTCSPKNSRRFNGATARRPWKAQVHAFAGRGQVASMGPRLGGRGKFPSHRQRSPGGWMLQWGHGSEAVERIESRPDRPAITLLQWGHGSEAVERTRNTPRSSA